MTKRGANSHLTQPMLIFNNAKQESQHGSHTCLTNHVNHVWIKSS